MRRILILFATHLLALGLGFGLGIYLLPILIAPDDPPVTQVQAAMNDATYRTTFRRDLKGSDAVHWAEGKVSVSATQVAFDGKMGPGPNYKVYLVRDFVDNKADFLKIKAQAQRIGEVKTFNRFLVDVPANVDVDDYTTVVVWCERFSQFMGEIKRNGTALGHIVSAELMYSNNLDKVEVIRPDGRIEDADPAMVAVTGNVTVRFADTVLLDQATSGDPCELSFGWQIDADNSLLFTVHSVFLPKAKTPIQGPGGIQAAFAWQAAKDSGLGKTCTAVLINDVVAY